MNNNIYIENLMLSRLRKRCEKNNDNQFISSDSKPNVACIMDEFSYNCFKYECNLYQITPLNWQSIFIGKTIDILLVESAWLGYKDSWSGKLVNYKLSSDMVLEAIIDYCNTNSIPTVFWSKEDPYDFKSFVQVSRLFEYVFSNDIDTIDKYKKILKHNNVFLLPFAAQPILHNPINKDCEKKGQLIFAGGWYDKFPNRNKSLEYMLDASINYNLTIYDRFYNKLDKNKFPSKYRSFIKESLNYMEIIDEIKKYQILLNANSVDDSKTNFSRRVFETLLSGTPIISPYSLGIENYFKDIVQLVNSPYDVKSAIDRLLTDKLFYDKTSLLGIRAVMDQHTYRHRFNTILSTIGLDKYLVDHKEGVSVITITNRGYALDNIIHNYLSQNFKNKELIIILNRNSIDLGEWRQYLSFREDIQIYQLDEKKTLGECLNYAIERSSNKYISKFDDDDFYGPNYLIDAINAFKYTDASIVGKYTVYAYMEAYKELILRFPNFENRYMNYVAGSTLTFKKEIWLKVKFRHLDKSEDTLFLKDCLALGYKIYATDKYNHVIVRRNNLHTHTWKISSKDFRKNSITIRKTKYFKELTFV